MAIGTFPECQCCSTNSYVVDEGKSWTAAPNFLAYRAPARLACALSWFIVVVLKVRTHRSSARAEPEHSRNDIASMLGLLDGSTQFPGLRCIEPRRPDGDWHSDKFWPGTYSGSDELATIARQNSRGGVPLMRLNSRLKCEISRKPAANAISAIFLFRGLSSKSRVQTAIRFSLTCSPTERPVPENSLCT